QVPGIDAGYEIRNNRGSCQIIIEDARHRAWQYLGHQTCNVLPARPAPTYLSDRSLNFSNRSPYEIIGVYGLPPNPNSRVKKRAIPSPRILVTQGENNSPLNALAHALR